MSPGYQFGWVLVRALLQVADVSLCPHMVKRARGLGGVCCIRTLIPFRGFHPSTTNWHWVWCSLDFPHSSASKESICNAGDLGSIPGSGRSPGEGNCYPLQYSGLENSTDRGDWQATVHKVTKSWTRPRDFHFHSVIVKFKAKDPTEGLLSTKGSHAGE